MRWLLLPVWCCFALLAQPVKGVDLLERYPTSLTGGDARPEQAREWEFTTKDLLRLTQFHFEVGKQLELKTGPADLGIGHCADGAVWAVVIPRSGGTLVRDGTDPEPIAHVWLRFHPREITRLFPPETVLADGNTELVAQAQNVARAKMASSWQAGGRALIPEPKDVTVDVDVEEGMRRFFVVDRDAETAEYIAAFETRYVKPPHMFTPELAAEGFDQLWEAFDRDYAMFVLRPEVDWDQSRERFRPRALASASASDFAQVCAEMLRQLRDLHIWLTVADANVRVFNRVRTANANLSAYRGLLGELHGRGGVQWAVTWDRIGFLAIHGWSAGPAIPARCDAALEAMRDTRGMIVDVRLNGGGDELAAREVAGRFLSTEFVYAYSQYRNGNHHTNLTERYPRAVQPRGPWRYDRPVILLIGEKCMSSNESFIGMMSGATNVTTMGESTCGSSGNPRIVQLPMDVKVSLPRWIDYLPDGTPLDERGFTPQVQFEPEPGAFEGERDDLLLAALDRLRQVPLPAEPIGGPDAGELFSSDLREYAAWTMAEAQDASRPHVVSVFPTNGALSVAPVTELRVRFDRSMAPLSLQLDWDAGGFTDCEFPEYDPETYEFILPVHLTPGEEHVVVVNKPMLVNPTQDILEERERWPLHGFHSPDNHLAGLFAWHFRTRSLAPPETAKPAKPIRISPASGSRVAALTFLEIEFDEPMSPPSTGLPYVMGESDDEKPQRISHVEYDAGRRVFRLAMLLPPSRDVEFVLAGFRAADGTTAEPIPLSYQVAGEARAATDLARARIDAKDPQLLSLLETMQRRRMELSSISERVQTLSLAGDGTAFTRLQSKCATFRWQQPDRYHAEVGEFLGMCDVWRIGSDGKAWWWHYASPSLESQVIVCSAKDMHTCNVSICDPFGLMNQSPTQAAANLGLRLVGVNEDPEAFLLQAWSATVHPSFVSGRLRQWHIDRQTFRLKETVTFYPFGEYRTRFHYDMVDEPLPDATFAVPQIEGIPPSPPDELDQDYTERFIDLRDGSDGTMNVRWGKRGPIGSSTSGF